MSCQLRRAPPQLLLEIDIGERLPVGVADDEAPSIQLGVGFLDGPRRREAAFGLVDHCTIADPRLQATQGQRRDADLRMRETPAVLGWSGTCRGLLRVAGGDPLSGGSLNPGAGKQNLSTRPHRARRPAMRGRSATFRHDPIARAGQRCVAVAL